MITRLVDPNLYYSRFSFFESDKKAISLKYSKKKGGIGLPALKAKYNTRSPLMKALVPKPSEGTCRIMFNIYKSPQYKRLPKITSLSKPQKDVHGDTSVEIVKNLNSSMIEHRNKTQLLAHDSINLKNQKHSVQANRAYHDLNLNKKGEMFSIVAKKVNKEMKKRHMKPIFEC